jgi:hypothetical protein
MNTSVTKPDANVDDFLVPTGTPKSNGPLSGFAPYIAFRGRKSVANTDDLDATGIDVGTFYLVDGQPWKVDPLTVHLLRYEKFYTMQDDAFKVLAASRTEQDGMQEHIEAVVLVVRPGSPGNPSSFVPARLTLRGGQAAALRMAINVYEGTAKNTPSELAALGVDYIPGSKCKVVGGRFRVWIRSEEKKSQKTGRTYNNGIGRLQPTPAADVPVIESFSTAGHNQDRLLQVAQAWSERVDEIEALIE